MFPLFVVFFGLTAGAFALGSESQPDAETAAFLAAMEQRVHSSNVPSGPFSANIVCAEQASGKIIIFKPGTDRQADWNKASSIVWEWDASQSKEILPNHRNWFSNPDECKPVLGTSHLLLTASGGGVALVRLSDKSVRFYAYAGGNPHSAALLPDGNVVSISSAGYFTVYAVPETFTSPDVKTVKYPAVGGHGIVWDKTLQRLWVLGYTELAAYKYNFDKSNPAMTKDFFVSVEKTPAHFGHDLYPIPVKRLLFATGTGVAAFDIQTRQFTELSAARGIKSVSQAPDGSIIVLSPTKEWWSESVTFFNDSLTPVGTRSGARIYKARWWTPNTMSE